MFLKKTLIILLLVQFSFNVFSQKTLKMVEVRGGAFEMGGNDENFKDEMPLHTVNISDYYISQYEISFDDYSAFCKHAGFSEPYGSTGFPASNITWERAVMMCNWLSRRDGFEQAYKINRDQKQGIFEVTCDFNSPGYRLPTEAEWEYAARGGHRSKDYKFSGSNSPYLVAWFNETYQGLEHKGGELLPNELGLYDMTGNVAEWCWDYYDPNYYKKKVSDNPKGPTAGTARVYRGGTRRDKMVYIETSRRSFLEQNKKNLYVGFRVVRTKTD
jgi:formylglycine-generating enzyme required for sulfatase activity